MQAYIGELVVMALIVVFHNDSTGGQEIGNYNIKVYINETCIYTDRFEGHKRKRGWQKLVHDWINGKVIKLKKEKIKLTDTEKWCLEYLVKK